ncbi:Putative mediator complex, subunit Med6 [Septoria linicola]|uniref:Mediator of RNA polymerase II transcription subunit 6 n=1 Tax=Septoria linicola TaxID=215465 RepID=A0A9Q9ASD4_9PEZI|nr:putative mediator complex, subunit Med6 [Septoria linicola]USW49871.1 Putative mediator complex, subunit Med6 [Septoria linicola]
MAAQNAPALDEIVHAMPQVIDWWVNTMGGKAMDENMIHRYMTESPFFEWGSKNGLLFEQGKVDWATHNMCNNRRALEDNLRGRVGLEYMIVQEPQPVADKELAAQGVTTGIYVIRKQDRQRSPAGPRVRPPGVILEDKWELTVLGTYFIVGQNVYQAPNVFDVVENRLLSASSSLNKLIDGAIGLPRYNPASGYSYLPPSQSTKRVPTAAGSVAASPTGSREGSVAPGADSQSLRSGSLMPEPNAAASKSTLEQDQTRLLATSLAMSMRYAHDYTDENPLIGEPGSFKFAMTEAAVKKRRAEEEAAAAEARAKKESASNSRAASPKPEAASPKVDKPPAAFTTETKLKTEEKRKNSTSSGKKKRDRKKGMSSAGPSPTTPSASTAPTPKAG